MALEVKMNYEKLTFKDDCSDLFLLFKKGGIYKYDKNTINVHTNSLKLCTQLQKIIQIQDLWSDDNNLYLFKTKVSNLDKILQLGGVFKKRPRKNGNWLKKMEKILGHSIIYTSRKWR